MDEATAKLNAALARIFRYHPELQKAVAQRADVSQQFVSAVVTGKKTASPAFYKAAAEALAEHWFADYKRFLKRLFARVESHE